LGQALLDRKCNLKVVLAPVAAMSIAAATVIPASLAITSVAAPSAPPLRVTLHGFGAVTFKLEVECKVLFLFLRHLVHSAILVVPRGLHLHMAF
jgi:hypothetical protein